jgi:hypothetical protein
MRSQPQPGNFGGQGMRPPPQPGNFDGQARGQGMRPQPQPGNPDGGQNGTRMTGDSNDNIADTILRKLNVIF